MKGGEGWLDERVGIWQKERGIVLFKVGGVWLDKGGLCELSGGVRLDEMKGGGPYGQMKGGWMKKTGCGRMKEGCIDERGSGMVGCKGGCMHKREMGLVG